MGCGMSRPTPVRELYAYPEKRGDEISSSSSLITCSEETMDQIRARMRGSQAAKKLTAPQPSVSSFCSESDETERSTTSSEEGLRGSKRTLRSRTTKGSSSSITKPTRNSVLFGDSDYLKSYGFDHTFSRDYGDCADRGGSNYGGYAHCGGGGGSRAGGGGGGACGDD